MIQNLTFGFLFFLKILFRAYKLFVFVHKFQWISSKFFNFSKSQADFTIQFRSKNLTHFTSLNPLDIENNMLP